MMVIKICGNTRKEDLVAADKAGADIVGVVVEVAASKRSLDRISAQNLFSTPINADKAMLLCNHSLEESLVLLDLIKPNVLHLTGDEPPEVVNEIKKRSRVRLLKSVHLPVTGNGVPLLASQAVAQNVVGCIDKIKSYADSGVKIIVLDASDPSRKLYGGTGMTCDWDAAAEIVKASPLPVLLAGGLNPDNVIEAIRRVRPHGIDLASGVESEVRIKDHEKIKLLSERVRQCEAE